MKFLFINNKQIIKETYENIFVENVFSKYENFNYFLKLIKNRKNVSNIRPGVSVNNKKNSIKRDKNFSILKQFININTKKGKSLTIFSNINIMYMNLFDCLSNELEDFSNLKNYSKLVYVFNIDPSYSDLNKLLHYLISGLESVFEIKTSKNNKKLNLKTKYSHEIIYIPKERRLKYVLRSLSTYKEYFKNYSLWERFFWSFLTILLNKDKSFLKKRRDYIYLKSIKFFKKKKTSKKIL